MSKVMNRLRRAFKTRSKIKNLSIARLTVYRSNTNIYAQIIAETNGLVLASASTVEREVRENLKNGGNVVAAGVVGKRIAEKAVILGIKTVAFDRSGYKYHGRVKALADAAREHGLSF